MSDSFSMIELTLGWIKIPNFTDTGLMKVEICLVNNKGAMIEDNFMTTRNCSSDHVLSIFESEAKEITGSRTDFRDTKFVKLPNVEKISDFKDY